MWGESRNHWIREKETRQKKKKKLTGLLPVGWAAASTFNAFTFNVKAARLFALRVDITGPLRPRLRTPVMLIPPCISTISGFLAKYWERERERGVGRETGRERERDSTSPERRGVRLPPQHLGYALFRGPIDRSPLQNQLKEKST